jgi:hypothetical protein
MKKTLICLLGLTFAGCGQVAEPETPVTEGMPTVDAEAVMPVDVMTTPEVVVPTVPEMPPAE